MLDVFVTKQTYFKLGVRLFVDLGHSEAEATISYDRVIVRMEKVPFYAVRTPEMAEAWMSRPTGERGNFIEYLEWACRTGVLTAGS